MGTGKGIEEKALLRSMELSGTSYCPAQAMMGQIMPIELKYSIYEDMGQGVKEETFSGMYTLESEVAHKL